MSRVLLYTQAFSPLSETFIYRMSMCLRERHSVAVLTHARANAVEFPAEGLNVIVEPEAAYGRLARLLVGGLNAIRWRIPSSQVIAHLPREVKPDVIFAQFATCGFRILPAALRGATPVVTMFHGCDLGSWLNFPNYRRSLATLFSRGAAFVVATEYMRTRALSLGAPADRTFVIPYPIPRTEPQEHAAGGQRFRFLHVGRLHEQKGILYTIEAFGQVVGQGGDAELVVVGDGPQRREAEALVRSLGLESRIAFRGAMPFTQVRREFADADVYVIHSVTTREGDTEGFGVSLAEAAEMGLPVIATDHNGFPDVVVAGKTGLLVPERDVAGMSRAMWDLLHDPGKRSAMAAAGRAYVHERFDPASVGVRLGDLLADVASRAKGAT